MVVVGRLFELALYFRDLAFERLQLVHRAAQSVGQAAANGSAEGDVANDPGNLDHVARQAPAQSTVLLRLHLTRNSLQLLPVLLAFPVIFLDFAYLSQQFFELNREILI